MFWAVRAAAPRRGLTSPSPTGAGGAAGRGAGVGGAAGVGAAFGGAAFAGAGAGSGAAAAGAAAAGRPLVRGAPSPEKNDRHSSGTEAGSER
jgi:hypothetical protein